MNDVEPYRVEWRPFLSTRWALIGSRRTRAEADSLAVETIREFHGDGFCRLIVQHVVAESERSGQWEVAP